MNRGTSNPQSTGTSSTNKSTGSKTPPSRCICRFETVRFDAIAEPPEFADHSRSAPLPRLCVESRAPFFVTDSLVQDLPNQGTLPMGNCSDRLFMPQTWHRTAIDNLEDTSL